MRNALNFVAFQVAWLVTVRAAAHGQPWTGPAAMALVVTLHLALAERRGRELVYLLGAGLLGTLVDGGLARLGALRYVGGADEPRLLGLVLPWVSALWVGFATLPSRSLAWLRPRPLLAALLGGLGGPLSYLGGVRLGAVAVAPQALLTWSALALEYALVCPLLLVASARWASPAAPRDVPSSESVFAVSRASGPAGRAKSRANE